MSSNNKWITKKRVGIGSVILAASLVAYAISERSWPKVDEISEPIPDDPAELVKVAKKWLDSCETNKESKQHWLNGIEIVRHLFAHLKESFKIECDDGELSASLLANRPRALILRSIKVTKGNRCIFISEAAAETCVRTESGNFMAEDFLDDKMNMFVLSRNILGKLEDTFSKNLFSSTASFRFFAVTEVLKMLISYLVGEILLR